MTSKFWLLLNQPACHGPFRPKLWTALATIFVGIFFEKNFGKVLDLYQLPIERNFEHLEKNGVLQFFEQVAGPDDNAVHGQTDVEVEKVF